MAVTSDELRESMRTWTSGVAVVTAAHEGFQHGMTVSSFTSVSLEPPLVVISLQIESRTCGLVMDSGKFGVTILSEDQQELSEHFAGRVGDQEDRISGLDLVYMDDLPFLTGGLAFFVCRVVDSYDGGMNRLFFGEVEASRANDLDGRPLMYFNRTYRNLPR